ncbi:hypothetical protein LWC34_49610 [Kibdelosporangium philippinense]|uniref:Uncharacterized protein n=2 Tax=Kibdelosporangium philippinense TaxID=211113 RepID=A0ABS8ZT90_9PSEU|nr:hypothetical protein [Kibdelosporangium philippinense]MCE7010809.1 hypothetical protein [Kibdelosporangium philippinense]
MSAVVGGAFTLLIALAIARPVYVEIGGGIAFQAGTLETTSAHAIVITHPGTTGSYSTGPSTKTTVTLPNGKTHRATIKQRELTRYNGQTVTAGLFSGEVVAVNGYDVTGMFSFGYFVLLMMLTGMTVFSVTMVIKRRSLVPDHKSPVASVHAWSAAWLSLVVAGVFDILDTPWWPVIAWGGCSALFLTVYSVKYVRVNRLYRADLVH